MDSRRTRRILIAALFISLLAHLVVALVVRWPFVFLRDEPRIVTLEHRVRTIAITRRPSPPPPSPLPRASSLPHAVHHLVVPRAVTPHAAGTLPAAGEARPSAATPASQPVATAPPPNTGCPSPDSVPSVIATPPPAEIPPAVRAAGASGTARVEVRLNEQGEIVSASIAQSSGNAALDAIAEMLAKGARYAPAYHACKAVAGTYAYSVTFAAI